MKRLAILLLYVYLHLPFCYGQVKALVGSVTDEESGEPVAGAIVQAVDGKSYTFTTNDGRFSLKGEARQIRVQSMGYQICNTQTVVNRIPFNDFRITGVSNSSEFQKLDREIQWQAFIQLKELGTSVRQLQRLTGIDRGIIQRAR